ncbi:MAG: 4-alpha-glucanotransferase [Deltaproteobacteria bacterium]
MSRPARNPAGDLRRLARACGVQTAYYDIRHRRVEVPAETLQAVLSALGEPVDAPGGPAEALRGRERAARERICEPVVVAWQGEPAALFLRLPEKGSTVRIRLTLEGGEVRGIPPRRSGTGLTPLPRDLPAGYHTLEVEAGSAREEALLIAAPRRAWPDGGKRERRWGVFLPLYALRSERNLGAGDLSDLEGLLAWTAARGGAVTGTLPLLAAFLDEPFHPSPYSPASRLFWNEFYLDLERDPVFRESERARTIAGSGPFRREAAALRRAPHVDYRRGMALRRKVLEAMAETFFAGGGDRSPEFRRYLAEHPDAPEYAAFRAAGEALRAPWAVWPEPMREGTIPAGSFRERDRQTHLFAQFAFDRQFAEVTAEARKRGQSLYLDLPLGVAYDSYDVWRHRDLFVLDVAAGAPPDDFFTRGQDWGFPPMHPERIREEGYRYYRACLRNQLRHAGILRIDHVMGFHRFFWVPKGMEARQGTYVRYRAEEFYAILAVESHRHRAVIVGEDLGTVPPHVRPAMARRGIRRMFVVQFSLSTDPEKALGTVPGGCLASVNTHDMPTFAAFWEGRDIRERVSLGLLDGKGRREEEARRGALKRALSAFLRRNGRLAGRTPGAERVLSACLAHLAGSRAGTVVVNLEDLWGETEPQNLPGTWKERPNWMRKARRSLEDLQSLPRVDRVLREVDRLRRRDGAGNRRAETP